MFVYNCIKLMFNYNNYSVKRRRIYGRRATATPSRNLVHKFLLQFFTRTANHFLPRGICLTYVDPTQSVPPILFLQIWQLSKNGVSMIFPFHHFYFLFFFNSTK